MTTTNNMNTNFKFRTKFKKLLNEENSAAIMSAFEKFCSLDSADAHEVLWKMTYSSETALVELYKLGLDCKTFPSEKTLNLRNELRYQYEEMGYDFMDDFLKDDEKINNAFLNLKTNTDRIVAIAVYAACVRVLNNPKYNIDRILGLLKHSEENYYFGGIRSMSFDMEETEYLKPYHIEIYNLLEAMSNFIPFYSEEEETENVVKAEETETFEEARGESKQIEEEPKEFFQESEDVEVTTVIFKTVTPEEIIANKEVFKLFAESNDLNMLLPIGNLGFDLNQVMIKKEEIHSFIIAYEALIK